MPSQQPNGEATGQTEAASNGPSSSKKTTNTSQIDNEEACSQHNGSQSRSSIPLRPIRSRHSTGSTPSRPRWRRYLSKIGFFVVDQWFLFALGFSILLASQVQVPGSHQEKKEIVVKYLCVAIIFFITGCTLSNYSGWKLHILVQIQSFLLMSAIVYAVVTLCATSPDFMDAGLLVGMIFTECVPTTISSNVIMTKQANGVQALNVVQSTLGNFLGPFISPLILLIYTNTGAWDTKKFYQVLDQGALVNYTGGFSCSLGFRYFFHLPMSTVQFSE